MPKFTINNENEIISYECAENASMEGELNAISFDSQEELAKVTVDWPTSRWVEIWNSIPGNTPVKKFTDRKTAVARIWKAVQQLARTDEPSDTTLFETEPVAPAESAVTPTGEQLGIAPIEPATSEVSEPSATMPEATLPEVEDQPSELSEAGEAVPVAPPSEPKPKRGRKAAKVAATAKEAADQPGANCTNKKADVIAMMKREGGVSLAEIMTTTGWQKHTVRGFVSILGGKGGLTILSTKSEAGDRVYSIAQ